MFYHFQTSNCDKMTRYLAGVIRIGSESSELQDGQDCLRVTLEYTFGAESISLAVSVALASPTCPVAHLPSLPRVGLRMVLPSSFSKMTWLGQGIQRIQWAKGATLG